MSMGDITKPWTWGRHRKCYNLAQALRRCTQEIKILEVAYRKIDTECARMRELGTGLNPDEQARNLGELSRRLRVLYRQKKTYIDDLAATGCQLCTKPDGGHT